MLFFFFFFVFFLGCLELDRFADDSLRLSLVTVLRNSVWSDRTSGLWAGLTKVWWTCWTWGEQGEQDRWWKPLDEWGEHCMWGTHACDGPHWMCGKVTMGLGPQDPEHLQDRLLSQEQFSSVLPGGALPWQDMSRGSEAEERVGAVFMPEHARE